MMVGLRSLLPQEAKRPDRFGGKGSADKFWNKHKSPSFTAKVPVEPQEFCTVIRGEGQ